MRINGRLALAASQQPADLHQVRAHAIHRRKPGIKLRAKSGENRCRPIGIQHFHPASARLLLDAIEQVPQLLIAQHTLRQFPCILRQRAQLRRIRRRQHAQPVFRSHGFTPHR